MYLHFKTLLGKKGSNLHLCIFVETINSWPFSLFAKKGNILLINFSTLSKFADLTIVKKDGSLDLLE